MAKSRTNAPTPPETPAPPRDGELLADPWLSERDAAAYLGYSVYHLQAMRLGKRMARGSGPAFEINGRGTVRYKRSALDAWQRGGKTEAAG